jgi:hypothetical protein
VSFFFFSSSFFRKHWSLTRHSANNAARTLQAYTLAAANAPANVAPANVGGGTIAAMGSDVATGTSTGNNPQRTNGASSAVSDMRLVGAVVGLAAVAFAL